MPFPLPDFKKVPVFGFFIDWLQNNDMDYGLHVTAIAALLLYIAFNVSDTLMGSSFAFFFGLAPIWLPILVFSLFFMRWKDYITKKYWLFIGRTTFRIKLPQEVQKSPASMEYVLHQIWNKQTIDNLWQAYIDGKQPHNFGLEIASIGGDVRFYVNLYTKKATEAFVPAIYSQYPGVEVIEEPVDYTAEIPLGDPDWDIMSHHINKKEKVYGPINTYIDFGLDKMPKEEEKSDPLTPLLEMLGSIPSHERVYIQIVIKSFRTQSLAQGNLVWKETDNWNVEVLRRVDELMRRDPETKAPLTIGETDFEGSPRVTPQERADIEALERNATKYAYQGGIRILYMAKKGHFRSTMINPLNRLLTQWDRVGRASLGVRWRTDFNYMWFSDPFGDRLSALKEREHKELKLRWYTKKNFMDDMKLYTTEELASIYHLPGKVALTPTLERIPSARSQAPSNLPVGEPPTVV